MPSPLDSAAPDIHLQQAWPLAFDLAMVLGSSLDRKTTCADFLRRLVVGGLAHWAGVWGTGSESADDWALIQLWPEGCTDPDLPTSPSKLTATSVQAFPLADQGVLILKCADAPAWQGFFQDHWPGLISKLSLVLNNAEIHQRLADHQAMTPKTGAGGQALRALHESVLSVLESRENTLLFKAVIDTIPAPLFFKDPAGRYQLVNQAFCEFHGFLEERLLGRTVYECWPQTSAEIFYAKDKALFEQPGTQIYETRITNGRGDVRDVMFHKATLHRADGLCLGMIGVFIDLTERRRAEDQIRHLNEVLEQRVKARTADLESSLKELQQFSYSVSHDLRAPLRGINGYAHLLVDELGVDISPSAREYLGHIRAASERLGQLIDDLLQLAKVSRMPLEQAPVNLSYLAEAILDDMRLSDSQHRPDYTIAPDLKTWGDARQLRLVLQNLLDNAWKFTRMTPLPRIEFGIGEIDGQPCYYVRDNGAGFDMAHAGNLFKPFERLHGAKEFPGSGIGLATVKRVIERHGGRIWAHSAPGSGAVFRFTLPHASPPQPPEKADTRPVV